ncbi:unnamed protein product [Arabidopsis thaliana]|uniref:(thale cress) hypothetical protein n=1 Tax=Arabidopsis thaliana TaxID=3702 RepID=A0A7G2DZT2_ARATH|nr:unnamed protein product [Arabidopsis thaliana]
MGQSGLGRHRPVILPPSRTEGGRCSVKPASRGLLRSKEILAPNLRSADISTPDLEWAGQLRAQPEPDTLRSDPMFHHLIVSTRIINPRY